MAIFESGTVVGQPESDSAGVSVLKRGGNAVDAAIATHFALAVVHPTAGNVGGGGFMVVRMADGTSAALDFRERAPLASTPDMYLDEDGEDWGDDEELDDDGELGEGAADWNSAARSTSEYRKI